MSELTKLERLLALKALRFAYKEVLVRWLKRHNKKGVKYTIRMRREWLDEDGYTHLGEREYCEPMTIKSDGELTDFEETLPYLKPETMNKIFEKAGLGPVDFKRLSTRHSWFDRAVDYLNDTYET